MKRSSKPPNNVFIGLIAAAVVLCPCLVLAELRPNPELKPSTPLANPTMRQRISDRLADLYRREISQAQSRLEALIQADPQLEQFHQQRTDLRLQAQKSASQISHLHNQITHIKQVIQKAASAQDPGRPTPKTHADRLAKLEHQHAKLSRALAKDRDAFWRLQKRVDELDQKLEAFDPILNELKDLRHLARGLNTDDPNLPDRLAVQPPHRISFQTTVADSAYGYPWSMEYLAMAIALDPRYQQATRAMVILASQSQDPQHGYRLLQAHARFAYVNAVHTFDADQQADALAKADRIAELVAKQLFAWRRHIIDRTIAVQADP